MRPQILNPLFAGAATLSGVGPKSAKLFDRLLARGAREARLVDILFHLPTATIDRRARPKIAEAARDAIVTLEVRVAELRPPPNVRSKAPYRVRVEDETGDVELVFFLANHAWIERSLPLGEKRWVSGKLELWEGHLQMVHPDRVLDAEAFERLPAIEPVYGLTEGLSARLAARAAEGALSKLPKLPEWLDPAFSEARHLPSFDSALQALHRPAGVEIVDPAYAPRVRLAYDELLANQLALLLVRGNMRRQSGRPSLGEGELARGIEASLPFALTSGQSQALAEIHADLASERRMLRLLQGDVGSGKTIVAFLAMAGAVEAGRQAALMAPTEILARQHFERLTPLADAAGISLVLVTGRDTKAERARALAALAAGDAHIAIGTHALFQESVAFRDLAFAVVDEQHRFGVQQRLALGLKGSAVDILVMTATPIPRTLVLTNFGDMEVSSLREKPPGRQPIDTRAMPLDRLDEIVAGLGRAIDAGAQIYWVCPLVEESEDLDLAAAEERFETLQQFYGSRVGLIHGQMKGRDKDEAMERFLRGETSILVATTVIEVGVDVPQASIMIIEHAERFGLAQLHQLRGRVGRGNGRSSCILLYKAPLGEVARGRIEIMRETEDGFRIAEEDLRLRGEGEVLGTRQSGLPGFRLADLSAHGPLLAIAHDDARLIVARDPQLESERGKALRVLLYLFERDEAARLLRAG